MGNQLDELTGPVSEQGRDVNVIHKQIPIKVGAGSLIFEIMLWVLGIIPGIVFAIMKVRAKNYLQKLEQRIQRDASQIDNYLEQRVIVLQNVVGLVSTAIDLDKDTMKTIAAYRGGSSPSLDAERNNVAGELDSAFSRINVAFEAYPDLKAHATIADAMRQNSYLQEKSLLLEKYTMIPLISGMKRLSFGQQRKLSLLVLGIQQEFRSQQQEKSKTKLVLHFLIN